MKKWNLPQPEVLISITGDDKYFHSNPKLAIELSERLTQVWFLHFLLLLRHLILMYYYHVNVYNRHFKLLEAGVIENCN